MNRRWPALLLLLSLLLSACRLSGDRRSWPAGQKEAARGSSTPADAGTVLEELANDLNQLSQQVEALDVPTDEDLIGTGLEAAAQDLTSLLTATPTDLP